MQQFLLKNISRSALNVRNFPIQERLIPAANTYYTGFAVDILQTLQDSKQDIYIYI